MSVDTHPAVQSGTFDLGGDQPVVRLGYGSMRLTGPGIWGEPGDHDEAIRVLRRAVELGVTLIDTADSYGPDVSEELIAEALHPYPAGLVIATKGGYTRSGADRWSPNGRPDHLRRACEGSLKRLRLERIDLYQLHVVDYRVPLEESIGALRDLQREGKVRHIGLSNVSVAELRRAQRSARVVSVQNWFNLLDRDEEDVLDYCEREGIAFIPYDPLGSGALARSDGPLARIGRGRATPAQLALAWLLQRSAVMLPIPGTASVAHLEENVGAAGLRLGERELEALEAAGRHDE